MNTQEMRNHLEKLDELLEKVEFTDIQINTLTESIEGTGGSNFPDLKANWIKQKEKLQEQRHIQVVDVRTYLNGMR